MFLLMEYLDYQVVIIHLNNMPCLLVFHHKKFILLVTLMNINDNFPYVLHKAKFDFKSVKFALILSFPYNSFAVFHQ
jgi:hypothetical protein